MEMPAVMSDDGMYPPNSDMMKATVESIKDVAVAEGVAPKDAVIEAVQPKLSDRSADVSEQSLTDALEKTEPLAPLETEEAPPPQTEDITPELELPPTPTPTPTVDPAIEEAA